MNLIHKYLPGVALVFSASMLVIVTACGIDNSGSSRESRATMQQQAQIATVVGMPAINNYTEKRMLKMIYELRDSANLVTYTYYIDLQGNKHKVCPTTSVGFGFPYATQYTAPKALRGGYPVGPDGNTWTGSARSWEADQPEPNGLYMPSSAEGTWVLCLGPDQKALNPVYVEPRVIVSPFPMD